MTEAAEPSGSAGLPVPAGGTPPALTLSREEAEVLVRAAAARYVASRRSRIDAFVDRHFTLKGSFAIHRAAFGWDLARTPYNLFATLPEFALRRGGTAAAWWWRRRGKLPPHLVARAERARLLLDTEVGKRVNALLMAEFLELPVKDASGRMISERDALALEILADPKIAAMLREVDRLLAARAEDPDFRRAVANLLAGAAAGRAAMAEVALQAGALGVGAGVFHSFTPGVLSLTPMVSATIANGLAISAFPLGGTVGGVWYAAFPAAAAPLLTFVTGATLLAGAAAVGAFAGIAADPIQRRLGLHRRRLERLVDALARDLAAPGRGGGGMSPLLTDHYLPRILDIVDLVNSLIRLTR